MYFSKFPLTFYTLDNRETVQLVTNIFLRVVFAEEIKNNLTLYELYDIVDGEAPEIISDKFYETPDYHWVILILNEVVDPRYDWPLSTSNLIKYCESKYNNINGIHHYIDTDGYIVNSTAPGATSVSNFQYEEEINEGKRKIKIIKPEYINQVVETFNSLLGMANG
mgnify:CR=1 FL=1